MSDKQTQSIMTPYIPISYSKDNFPIIASELLGHILLRQGKHDLPDDAWELTSYSSKGRCYVVWDTESSRPVYVGSTKYSVTSRIHEHRHGDSFDHNPTSLGEAIILSEPFAWDWTVDMLIPDDRWHRALDLERDLITDLQPRVNIMGVQGRDIRIHESTPWWETRVDEYEQWCIGRFSLAKRSHETSP